MKMKKVTAMSMAVLMAATMIPAVPAWQRALEKFIT